jgi:hypothetical protein
VTDRKILKSKKQSILRKRKQKSESTGCNKLIAARLSNWKGNRNSARRKQKAEERGKKRNNSLKSFKNHLRKGREGTPSKESGNKLFTRAQQVGYNFPSYGNITTTYQYSSENDKKEKGLSDQNGQTSYGWQVREDNSPELTSGKRDDCLSGSYESMNNTKSTTSVSDEWIGQKRKH